MRPAGILVLRIEFDVQPQLCYKKPDAKQGQPIGGACCGAFGQRNAAAGCFVRAFEYSEREGVRASMLRK